MALREMEQFNEIIDKIKYLINWYKYNNYENRCIKSFISSGNSFNYKINRDNIAHLLGVNISYITSTRLFTNTSSFELLCELCQNSYRLSSKIKDNEIKISNIFSKQIYKKLNNFKNNININLANTVLVCKYDRNKAINQGLTPRNCDFIIIKETDDDTLLELDLILKNKFAYPVSSRVYENMEEAESVFKKLFSYQDVAILSSIILDYDDYTSEKKIYLSEEQKLDKIEKLENYRLKYNCYIDVTGDFKYYCKRNQTNKSIEKNNYDIYDNIIMSIMEGNIIDTSKLNLTEQQLSLINAINDSIMFGSNNDNNKEKYSSLQAQLKQLRETNRELIDRNNELNNNVKSLKEENNKLQIKEEKTKELVKSINNAIDLYNNPIK